MNQAAHSPARNSDDLWKRLLLVFLLALIGYAAVFSWIEHRRRVKGPWQVTFTTVGGNHAIIVNQPTLQITNLSIVFEGAKSETNPNQTVIFEHGRAAPFDLPFGKCVFLDQLFLPGTVVCDLFGHEIQLLPRALTIDRVDHPWHSTSTITLTAINNRTNHP